MLRNAQSWFRDPTFSRLSSSGRSSLPGKPFQQVEGIQLKASATAGCTTPRQAFGGTTLCVGMAGRWGPCFSAARRGTGAGTSLPRCLQYFTFAGRRRRTEIDLLGCPRNAEFGYSGGRKFMPACGPAKPIEHTSRGILWCCRREVLMRPSIRVDDQGFFLSTFHLILVAVARVLPPACWGDHLEASGVPTPGAFSVKPAATPYGGTSAPRRA